jgi:hypothetical protein
LRAVYDANSTIEHIVTDLANNALNLEGIVQGTSLTSINVAVQAVERGRRSIGSWRAVGIAHTIVEVQICNT